MRMVTEDEVAGRVISQPGIASGILFQVDQDTYQDALPAVDGLCCLSP